MTTIELDKYSDMWHESGPFREELQGVDDVLVRTPLVPTAAWKRLAQPTRAQPVQAEVFKRAADIFLGARVMGHAFEDHVLLTARFSGLPVSVIREGSKRLANRIRGLSVSASDTRRKLTAGLTVRTVRRGSRLLVVAAGNHPGSQSLWPEALAFGYEVYVKPSARDPLTAARLVASLLEAGVDPAQLHLAVMRHEDVTRVLDRIDTVLAYGDSRTVRDLCRRPQDIAQGPGHSAVWIDGLHEERDVQLVVDSVAGEGGVGCINASSLYVRDVAHAVEKLRVGFAAHRPALPDDPQATLPVVSQPAAESFALVLTRLEESWVVLNGEPGPWTDLGRGLATLNPIAVLQERARPTTENLELPFPFVWVAPQADQDPGNLLRNALVATVVGDDPTLAAALDEPSIRTLNLGHVPTCRYHDAAPHDGYLAEYLTTSHTIAQEEKHVFVP